MAPDLVHRTPAALTTIFHEYYRSRTTTQATYKPPRYVAFDTVGIAEVSSKLDSNTAIQGDRQATWVCIIVYLVLPSRVSKVQFVPEAF
jgi:hypothetical protein